MRWLNLAKQVAHRYRGLLDVLVFVGFILSLTLYQAISSGPSSRGSPNPLDQSQSGFLNESLDGYPPEPTGQATNSAGVGKDTYTTSEVVYATGSDFAPNTYVNVHIVGDLAWSDGMAIPPDVSPDGIDTVLTDSAGNLGPTPVWIPPLTPGEYDMVFDANRNGVYDTSIDVVDHSAHPGFVVQASVPIGGIIVPVNKLELLVPWLGLAALISLAALGVGLVGRRRGRIRDRQMETIRR
jgi:hypothetical protein